MVLISFFKRKITNADHYLFGQTKTYGITLNFTNLLFQIYIIKVTNEMAACTVDLDCVQKNGNLELTVLNGWRRHTRSNMSIWYPAGHHFSRSVVFPIEIVSTIIFYICVNRAFPCCILIIFILISLR